MSEEKSHVGMARCFYCNELAIILLDRRLRKTLTRDMGVIDYEPCGECKKLMSQGVILISVRDGEKSENPYRTGGWVVVTDEFITKLLKEDAASTILKRRWAFVPDSAWDGIGLPREEVTPE